MKLCTKCNLVKDITEFSKNKCKPDGLQTWCKSCKCQIDKQNYKKNPVKHKRLVSEQRAKLKQEISNYKTKHGCYYCGEKHPACLDFHHLNPETKIKKVSEFAHQGCSHAVWEEISKCRIVCANCHRKLHYV